MLRIVSAVTFPPTTILESTIKPVVGFVRLRVWVVSIPDPLPDILDKRPPSPKNTPAVTFPPTTIFESTIKPVLGFVRLIVFDVVLLTFVTC